MLFQFIPKNKIYIICLGICLTTIKVSAQSSHKEAIPFLGVGMGATFVIPGLVADKNITTDSKATGSIPVSFGVQWGQSQLKISWYLKRFIPLLDYSYTVPLNNGSRDYFFSTINIVEKSFSLLYGHQLPFTFAKNQFNFYPKIGLNKLFVSRLTAANPKPVQPFRNINDKPDTLYVSKMSVTPKNILFISLGFELETKFIGKVKFFWENLFNINISGATNLSYNYSLHSGSKNQKGYIPLRWNNFHSSIGFKVPI